MNERIHRRHLLAVAFLLVASGAARPEDSPAPGKAAEGEKPDHRLLYVAAPGVRDDLRYGGHGLLVFDIDAGWRFVKRIPTPGLDEKGKPLNVKGICASAGTRRIYISTIRTLICLDLGTEKVLWEKPYEGGCDRMAITPDGKTIYLPSLEKDHWHVVDADGGIIDKIVLRSGSHNTVVAADGRRAFLAGLHSPLLTVADAATRSIQKTVGPFSSEIRPFTVNGRGSRCYVNVNGLLGFEVGDVETGKMLRRVEAGKASGEPKRHGCPSHGIALTPDEKEVWVTDAVGKRVVVFDALAEPERKVAEVALRDEPGWVTFGIDGQFAYPSTGDVVEVSTRRVVAGLKDETGAEVQSEKVLEIDFAGGRPVRAGNQFGVGMTR